MLSTGATASEVGIYGSNTNAFILEKDQVVEIVLNSFDPGKHPFHLHGHNFQVLARGDESAGIYTGNDTLPQVPMRRDTFMVKPNSYIVLRFKSDNPDEFDYLYGISSSADSSYGFGSFTVTLSGT